MKLSLLVIRCKDINLSKEFYETFGFHFQKEKHGNGPIHYSTEIDGIVFELYPKKSGEPIDNTRLGFNMDNLSVLLKDIKIDSTYESKGNKIYVIKDPDGRKVELF